MISLVEFIETDIFTRRIRRVLDDESYAAFQFDLAQNPAAGDLIPGSGGARKIRWGGSGRGKRGGMRIIYYWVREDREIYLIMAFTKNQKHDLSRREVTALAGVIRGLQ